jgi:xylulose-5-phosphate/fructose-6-phosphate phosphoketolase
MDETKFIELFTAYRLVVFAYHGYQRVIHEIVHGHIDVDRFHVRGFNEQGTTTTPPFDMVIMNGMSRYHLAAEALRRAGEAPGSRPRDRAPALITECEVLIARALSYSQEHLEDMPRSAIQCRAHEPAAPSGLPRERVLEAEEVDALNGKTSTEG